MITMGLGRALLSLANKAHKPARSGVCPSPQKIVVGVYARPLLPVRSTRGRARPPCPGRHLAASSAAIVHGPACAAQSDGLGSAESQ